MAKMNKRILSVLLCGSLLFGTVFANAVSISFDELDIETDDVSITYEELEMEEATTEENVIQNIESPLATEISEIEEATIEPETVESNSYIQSYALRNSNFDMTVTAHSDGYGSVSLDWSGYDYIDKNFKVYKSDDGGNTYQTVGIDYTLVDRVRVLNIGTYKYLEQWMETNGYGKGIIQVDTINISTYNAYPMSYLNMQSQNMNRSQVKMYHLLESLKESYGRIFI